MTDACQSTRYDPRPCEGPVTFRVVTRTSSGAVALNTPACFRHGLAEVDRAAKSGAISRTVLEGPTT